MTQEGHVMLQGGHVTMQGHGDHVMAQGEGHVMMQGGHVMQGGANCSPAVTGRIFNLMSKDSNIGIC